MKNLIFLSSITFVCLSTMAMTCDEARIKYNDGSAVASGDASGGGIGSACTAPVINIEAVAIPEITLTEGLDKYVDASEISSLATKLDALVKISDDSNTFADVIKKIEEAASTALPEIRTKLDVVFKAEIMEEPTPLEKLKETNIDKFTELDTIVNDPKYINAIVEYIIDTVGYTDRYAGKDPERALKLKDITDQIKEYFATTPWDYSLPLACQIVWISNNVSSFPNEDWLNYVRAWSGDGVAADAILQPLRAALDATIKDMNAQIDAAKKKGDDALVKKLMTERDKYKETEGARIEMLARYMKAGCEQEFAAATRVLNRTSMLYKQADLLTAIQ